LIKPYLNTPIPYGTGAMRVIPETANEAAKNMQDSIDDIPARDVLDLAPLGVMIVRGACILWMNRRLADWLGGTRESFTGLTRAAAETLGLGILFEDYAQLVWSGARGDIRLRCQRAALPDGGEVHFFEDLTEVARRERERDHFRELALSLETQDPETGLLNRQAILQALESQVNRSRRYGNPLLVIRLTVRPPEKPGAVALKDIAQELYASLRWVDQIGRLEDTSLLLILPETPYIHAETLATRLGRERLAFAGAEGWSIATAVAAFQTGDDARKLLRRLYPEPADG
jgi:GGDEF domain-containing protein